MRMDELRGAGPLHKQHAVERRVLVVFGTRPEAIKMVPVVRALARHAERIETVVCVTAQHRHMLDQVLDAFDVVPDIDLNLMRDGQDLSDLTAAVLTSVRDVIVQVQPDLVLVHGDTSTTLAAAMAAFHQRVPVGHVEAGLRTGDMNAPFPEEFNRQAVSKLAQWHFAPTQISRSNLLAEGVPESRVLVTGNTIVDAVRWGVSQLERPSAQGRRALETLREQVPFDRERQPFVVVTSHRRENFGAAIRDICTAIARLAERFPDLHFVFPVHLNPNVREPVRAMLSSHRTIHLVDPLDYLPFLELLRRCRLILTDSGGIQEEAASLGKPVLLMREVTERPEAAKAGGLRLVGANPEQIFNEASRLLTDEGAYAEMAGARNPFGDGHASERIADWVSERILSVRSR